DAIRNTGVQTFRTYSMLIKHNAGISDAAKIALGINPVNPNRQYVDVPGTSPIVSCFAATPFVHTLLYSDSTTPQSRAKPYGATQLEIVRVIGTGPATDWINAPKLGSYT